MHFQVIQVQAWRKSGVSLSSIGGDTTVSLAQTQKWRLWTCHWWDGLHSNFQRLQKWCIDRAVLLLTFDQCSFERTTKRCFVVIFWKKIFFLLDAYQKKFECQYIHSFPIDRSSTTLVRRYCRSLRFCHKGSSVNRFRLLLATNVPAVEPALRAFSKESSNRSDIWH